MGKNKKNKGKKSKAPKNKTKIQNLRAPNRDLDGCCKECFSSPVRICDLLNNTLLRVFDKYPLDPKDIEILDPTMVNANGKSVRKRYLDTLLAVFWPGTPIFLPTCGVCSMWNIRLQFILAWCNVTETTLFVSIADSTKL